MPTVHRPNRQPTLEEAQQMVGGMVEVVRLPSGDQLLANENGIALKLPYNLEASMLADRPILGDAVLLLGPRRWDYA